MNKNALISLLPDKHQESLLSNAELVDLKLSQVVCTVDQPITHIYFPINCFISITQNIDHFSPIEIGMVGEEGLLGAEIAIGAESNKFSALVQGAGNAWKIGAQFFLSEMNRSSELKSILHAYLGIRISQLGLSAGCEHFHEIGPRLAKWLLMSQDRAKSPTFLMTHEFMSLMLGVRRVGVTTTAADFRRRGLIQYHRGEIKILNRAALKAEACSCYQRDRKTYSSIIDGLNTIQTPSISVATIESPIADRQYLE
jgi:CRP-like cAMP-binding protein